MNEYKNTQLYKTTTNITLDEVKKSIVTYQIRNKQIYIFHICMMILMYILLAKFAKINYLVAILLTLVLPIVGYFRIVNDSKKIYKSIENLGSDKLEISFSEDKIKIISKNSEAEYKKSNISKIIETKTNFYILLEKVQTIIIIKENCSKELIELIEKFKINKNHS